MKKEQAIIQLGKISERFEELKRKPKNNESADELIQLKKIKTYMLNLIACIT